VHHRIAVASLGSYPNAQPPAAVAERLAKALGGDHHEFWADSIGIVDAQQLCWDRC